MEQINIIFLTLSRRMDSWQQWHLRGNFPKVQKAEKRPRPLTQQSQVDVLIKCFHHEFWDQTGRGNLDSNLYDLHFHVLCSLFSIHIFLPKKNLRIYFFDVTEPD